MSCQRQDAWHTKECENSNVTTIIFHTCYMQCELTEILSVYLWISRQVTEATLHMCAHVERNLVLKYEIYQIYFVNGLVWV